MKAKQKLQIRIIIHCFSEVTKIFKNFLQKYSSNVHVYTIKMTKAMKCKRLTNILTNIQMTHKVIHKMTKIIFLLKYGQHNGMLASVSLLNHLSIPPKDTILTEVDKERDDSQTVQILTCFRMLGL